MQWTKYLLTNQDVIKELSPEQELHLAVFQHQ